VILLDASGLLSALDESQRHHDECARLLGAASPPLLLSPFVLAELDELLMRHIGQSAAGNRAWTVYPRRFLFQLRIECATQSRDHSSAASRFAAALVLKLSPSSKPYPRMASTQARGRGAVAVLS
jgi:predicted nucleic acid-binding protein